jgi:hypothetical protein
MRVGTSIVVILVWLQAIGQVPVDSLALWLRADVGVVTSGAQVTQWLDQSGNGRHATASGNVQKVESLINGYPSVQLFCNNGLLMTPAFQTFPSKRGAIFVVARTLGNSCVSGAGYGAFVQTYYGSGTTWQFGAFPSYYGFYDGVGSSNFNVTTLPVNAWGIVAMNRTSNTTMDCYKSGIFSNTVSIANNQPSLNQVRIGASSTGWEVLNGYIAEVLIYNKAMSPGELEQVNTYLANKYYFNGDVPLPTANGASLCGAGSAILTASGGDAYRWFDSPTATVPISTSASFTTPVLNTSTTYYVANFNGQLQSQRVAVTVNVALPGSSCDDNDPGTINDQLDGSCACVGTPIYQDVDLALSLNGAFQHASTLSAPAITIGPKITVEAWIRPDAFDFGEIYSVCNDPNSPCTGMDYQVLSFRVDPGGHLTALISPTAYSTRLLGKVATTPLILGQWVHVAATLDLITNECRIYYNGVEQPGTGLLTGSGGGSFMGYPAIGSLQVSGWTNTVQYPFTGRIDDLRVWDAVLPGSSIAQFHCAYDLIGHPQAADLVGHYRIEDGQEPDGMVVDLAGGRHATLTNVSVAEAYVPSGAAQGGSCGCALGPIGAPCNDGNNSTSNDVITGACTCAGSLIFCTNDLILEFRTDAIGAQTTWEIRQQGTGDLMDSGGGTYPSNVTLTDHTCLPNGCYYLRVFDAGGDGIANGGYILRTLNGAQRIIDNRNNGNFGSVSAVVGNGGFCLPMGSDKLIYTSCDKLDWVNNQFLVAAPNTSVSAQWGVGDQTDDGYQFWIFDPNGTYGYAKFRNHATSDGFGPASATRACHMQINNWSPNQIPFGQLMNVKVRSRVNGTNSAWGPVCRFKIDPTRALCPFTKLMDIPGNQFFSCNVTRTWGGNNRIYARPVEGATQYQFRFNSAELAQPVVRTATTYYVNLNWTPALPNGTYQVQVRAFKNGVWCATSLPWGDECNVTITGSPNAMSVNGGSTVATGDAKLAMFPNPNNGEQLTVSLSAVEEGVNTVSVDIYDLTGAVVSSRTIAVNDGMVYQVLELTGMASGLYMVNITAGSKRYTERLVISK